MAVEINTLPFAAEADLQRVGQFLYWTHGLRSRIRRVADKCANVLCVATSDSQLGNTCAADPFERYRVLTEAQAVEVARTLPHVWPDWKATWPKVHGLGAWVDGRIGKLTVEFSHNIPPFASVKEGDSFEWEDPKDPLARTGERFVVNPRKPFSCIKGVSDTSGFGISVASAADWASGKVRNFKRAEPIRGRHAASVIIDDPLAPHASAAPITMVPEFGDIGVGDTFEWRWKETWLEQRVVEHLRSALRLQSGYALASSTWQSEIAAGCIRNFRRAGGPTHIGEILLEKMAEMERERIQAEPHPGYANKLVDQNTGPDGMVLSESMVANFMGTHNAEFCERQEAEKERIKRDWFRVHSATTNGLCVMRGRR